jgi:RNA polymerase sigma-70 factor (ECF subfamily)
MTGQPWLTTDVTRVRRTQDDAEVSDALLLDRIAGDDCHALDLAIQRYWRPLVGYLFRLVDTADRAEDIAQRTFCQLWDRRARWRREGSLRGLLYRVARNFALSERRRRLVEVRSATLQRGAPARNPTPVELLEDQQLRIALDHAIERLPRRRREVFVLRCVHDLSYKEIGEIMDISTQTVANQLSHALATLRRALDGVLDD